MSDEQPVAPVAEPVAAPASDAKKPWESKTIIINAILAIVGGVSLFIPSAKGISDFIQSHASQIGMAWGVLNVIIRFITQDKVSLVD